MSRHCKSSTWLVVATFIAWLAQAGLVLALPCSLESVPAATLLLPYFEVDLDDPEGVTTLFSINNASGTPALAHVVFWTDWSHPTLGFDVYLTGYDVVSINIRDVFAGNLPRTADAASDLNQSDETCGELSPCGNIFARNRHWDDFDPDSADEQGFPFCDQIFPGFTNPVVVGDALARLTEGHTGGVVPLLDACIGSDRGDNLARGYITIDSVSECSVAMGPFDTGVTGTPYFVDGGLGVANNHNVLWGDWSLVKPEQAFAQSDNLVHIEAHNDLNADHVPLLRPSSGEVAMQVPHETRYTFYGRYFQDPLDGRDNREPLGSTWATRYFQGGSFDQTEILVWRDPTAGQQMAVANSDPGAWCDSGPSWYPLNEFEILAFNEAEDAVGICFFTGSILGIPEFDSPACFPLATGRYAIGQGDLDVPFDFGWLYLNLNLNPAVEPSGPFGVHGNLRQSYVTALHSALGVYSVGLQAVEFHHACEKFNDWVNGAQVDGGVNLIPFF